MKVLFVKLSALGDILHAVPVAERVLHSGIETGWVVDARYASVLKLFPGLDHVHVLDIKGWGRTARSGRLIDAASQMKRSIEGIRAVGYDKVLDIQGLLKSAMVARLSGSNTVGFTARVCREPLSAALYRQRVPVDTGLTVTDQIMTLVSETLGVKNEPMVPRLAVPAASDMEAGSIVEGLDGRPPVVLVIGAGWPTKVLPEISYRLVAEELAEAGPLIALSGNNDENARAQRILAGIEEARVLHRLDLPIVAGVLRRASVVVGGDTGIIHLAALMGTRTVSFYGASLAARSGPVGDTHRHVQSNELCSPCFKRKCPDIVCMDRMDPLEIGRVAKELARDAENIDINR